MIVELPLAHHAAIAAIPFVLPALTVLLGVGLLVARDRYRARRDSD